MIKKVFPGALALLLLATFVAPPALARSAELLDIRVTKGRNDSMRVALRMSKPTRHEFFTLDNPYRVVVDLRGTALADGVRVPDGRGMIDEVRTGERPGGTLRVVLELKSAIRARGTWVDAGNTDTFVISLGDDTDFEEELVPVQAAHAPKETDRDIIIAIDAGHGGQDPGAIGRSGTQEKTVVLAIARALADRVNAEPGMRAILTRDRDEFLRHRERMRRARAARADMFVSIHADSIRDRSISGSSVYVLSHRGATDEAARWLAERENAADLIGGVKLDDKDDTLASVLLDLSQTASISASMTAAERVLEALDRVGEVRKPRVQQAPFLVLKSPDIPSLLIETAYISNPREEGRLKAPAYQKKLAEAIFSGIRNYFESAPPPGTRLAQQRRSAISGVVAASP